MYYVIKSQNYKRNSIYLVSKIMKNYLVNIMYGNIGFYNSFFYKIHDITYQVLMCFIEKSRYKTILYN